VKRKRYGAEKKRVPELAPHVIQKYYAQMHKPLVFAKQINA
jgi:hypothetical protein